MENVEFYIKRFSYCNEISENLKTIPMMLRRKLSNLDKLALSSMLEIYSEDMEELIISSRYGEFERLFFYNKSIQRKQ